MTLADEIAVAEKILGFEAMAYGCNIQILAAVKAEDFKRYDEALAKRAYCLSMLEALGRELRSLILERGRSLADE